jgi:ubiquitin carboxyl-terminal hydrolase 25/28
MQDRKLILIALAGKTPPRLINDLLDYDPRSSGRNGGNLLADPAPLFREGIHNLRNGESDCRHSLMSKPQTTTPGPRNEPPHGSGKYVVAAYCLECRLHFEITADFRFQNERQVPCSLSDETNPMHHLRLVKSMYSRENPGKFGLTKYNNFIECHQWVCSGAACPLTLEIKISPPRLDNKLISLITSPARVQARGKRVIAEDPDRYGGSAPLTVLQVLSNLRTYLSDAKEAKDKSELRRIATRNKKFMLAFADDCDNLFNHLDFILIKEDGPELHVSIIRIVSSRGLYIYASICIKLTLHQGRAELLLATTRFNRNQQRIHP